MTIEIKGTHRHPLDDETKEIINKKIARLSHVKDHVVDLHITLDRETHGEYKADANIHFRWGTVGHGSASSHEMNTAIDMLFDKLVTKATREKEKKQSHQ